MPAGGHPSALRVALAQVPLGDDPARNLDACVEAVEIAADSGARLVAFAELSHLPFFPQSPSGEVPDGYAETVPGAATDRLSEVAARRGVVIEFNLYERAGARCFDTSVILDVDGALLGVTRMVHITDFERFHEGRYYAPGDRGAPVYETALGRVGVAICYDRHFPEYTRLLGLKRPDLILVPQAGLAGEWSDGVLEAEIQATAFQNGCFVALVNRVGADGDLVFAGGSFLVDPTGKILARAAAGAQDVLVVDLDLSLADRSPARTIFLADRRPDQYEDLSRATART